MTTISALVVANSVGLKAPRLTTMLLTYPLIIHAEFMTHRVFSRNAASSRAIPIKRLIQSVKDDPFVPMVWTKNQPGMQGYEELEPHMAMAAKAEWIASMNEAMARVRRLDTLGVHKQIANRLLGPYAHIKVLVTGNYWQNFLKLRDHPKAEPHMRMLAQKVAQALESSTPQVLGQGEWHLPFVGDRITNANGDPSTVTGGEALANAITLSVARCASTSYKTVDDFDMTPERAQAVYASLLEDDPLHASPAEHQAQVDHWVQGGYQGNHSPHGWANPHQKGNFAPGWRQYRKMIPNEASMEDYT